jgi:ankyrin repeat protein
VDVQQTDGVTAIYAAAQEGHWETVKTLAALGADVSLPRNTGATPLYIAAEKGPLMW